jgi:hypothetical protein
VPLDDAGHIVGPHQRHPATPTLQLGVVEKQPIQLSRGQRLRNRNPDPIGKLFKAEPWKIDTHNPILCETGIREHPRGELRVALELERFHV